MTDVVELARQLVAIPSASHQSNVPVVDVLCDALASLGFVLRRYPQQVVQPGTGPKVNLIAERGDGPHRLAFCGHVDTVPVGDESAWTHDPYGRDGVRDGRLYGRGSVDMKGQVAAMAAAAAGADDALDDLTLVLAITADEEIGHEGIKSLTSEHQFVDAVGAVVCEPTQMVVYHAHKASVTARVDVRGVSCHSSWPADGVNAVDQAVRLIAALAAPLDEWCAARDPVFGDEPPTCAIVEIAGGIAHNVVPDLCTLHLNARALSAAHLDDFHERLRGTIARLQEQDAAHGVPPEQRLAATYTPLITTAALVCPTDSPWYRLLSDFTGQPGPSFARYGTDAGELSQTGMPCVVWGPGDIARAHTVDEYITVAEMLDGVTRYGELIRAAAVAASEGRLPAVTTRRWEDPVNP